MIREPFPHLVIDGAELLDGELLRAANDDWPAPTWPGWHEYRDEAHVKRASNLTAPIPTACAELLRQMAALPWGEWFGLPRLVPDLGLWGAGLHEVGPGGLVGPHVDADHHPRLGLSRQVSVMLYVHAWWDGEWGGNLVLHGEGGPEMPYEPRPGRLVAFATTGATHHVSPVSCPDGCSRRSLALFFYGPPAEARRPRAHFLSR